VYDGRDVPSLKGSWETPPYLRDGSAETLADAIARMEPYLGGRALGFEQQTALTAYVTAIPRFDRGRVADTGEPLEPNTLRMRRGHEVFVRVCAECHPPPLYTDRRRHDVDGAGELDTPTLRGIADSAPYGHDGRFGSLEAAIRAQPQDEALSERDLENLIEYLKLL
jgi:cytochrome c peroxidase